MKISQLTLLQFYEIVLFMVESVILIKYNFRPFSVSAQKTSANLLTLEMGNKQGVWG